MREICIDRDSRDSSWRSLLTLTVFGSPNNCQNDHVLFSLPFQPTTTTTACEWHEAIRSMRRFSLSRFVSRNRHRLVSVRSFEKKLVSVLSFFFTSFKFTFNSISLSCCWFYSFMVFSTLKFEFQSTRQHMAEAIDGLDTCAFDAQSFSVCAIRCYILRRIVCLGIWFNLIP